MLAAALVWLGLPAEVQAHVVDRVSLSTGGVQGDFSSAMPTISADGRYVAFGSGAGNLVPGDTNGWDDVFVRDRQTGATERVSVSSTGTQANGISLVSVISADGRYVAFFSDADNLVTGDTNGTADVFVHDLQTGLTERVSVSSAGAQGNGESYGPAISADGRYVAFFSLSIDLVTGDTNDVADIFVHDRVSGVTERVTVDSSEAQANDFSWDCAISADGRHVAFQSSAGNLVAGDTNGSDDIFVRDLDDGTTQRVSVDGAGAQANGAATTPPSAPTAATWPTPRMPPIWFRATRTPGETPSSATARPAPPSGRASAAPRPRATSPAAAAPSAPTAATLPCSPTPPTWCPAIPTAARTSIVRDREAGTTCRVNTSAAGVQANGLTSLSASLSAGGDYVAFDSMATNLVTGDTNGFEDVFVALNRLEPVDYRSLRGADRYDTAIKMSRAMFPGALPPDSGLVLAPGETYQEALCGGPLAAAYGGPVLLTPGVGLNNAVSNEIVRLAPKYVICIGLSDSIKDAVQAALGAMGSASAIRGGNNCIYDMSEQVARALGAKLGDLSGATAIITRGDNFPDAIGVSPLACANRWPILLTGNSTGALWADAAAALADLGISKALKVGTYVTLPAGVAGVANLSGSDRYATNRNVAEWGKGGGGLTFAHIGLATGDKFPDALAAGRYLAADAGILLLSPLVGPLPPVIATDARGQRPLSGASVVHRHDRAGGEPGQSPPPVGAVCGSRDALGGVP